MVDVSTSFGKSGCSFDDNSRCSESQRMSAGSKIYSIYAIDDGLLRLGKDEKDPNTSCDIYGSAPDKRSKVLEDMGQALSRK